MFHHVVLFRWNDQASAAAVTAIAAGLRACAADLDVVRHFECGSDVAAAGAAGTGQDRYDFALVAVFAGEDDWQVYDTDPEHQRVRAELIKPLLAERRVVQFTT